MMLLSIPISFFISWISYRLFRRAFGTMRIDLYFPHTHLFYFQMIAMSLIGIELMLFGIKSTLMEQFGVREGDIILAMISLWHTMLIISISALLVFRRANMGKELRMFLRKPFVVKNEQASLIVFRFFTIISVFVVVYIYSYGAPIFRLLNRSIGSVLVSRISYGMNFQGSYIIRNVLGQHIVVLISYIAYLYKNASARKEWKFIFGVNFICAIIIMGANLSKGGIANYIIPYFFLMVASGKRLKIKVLIPIVTALLLLVMVAYYIQSRGRTSFWASLFDVQNGMIGRIFYTQIQSLPTYFAIFPNMHPFTYGKGIAFLRFIGFEHIDSARIVATILEPEGVAQGWVGVANTLFIGDAYANFGWLGVVISPFIMSLWFCYFYRKLFCFEKKPVIIGAIITILSGLVKGFTGGFCSAYIINTEVISILGFVFLHHVLVRILSGHHSIVFNQCWTKL